jgi:hypothetical protein
MSDYLKPIKNKINRHIIADLGKINKIEDI